ncbi:unnamed protein product, partial [Prorocentrum cordatum]
PFWPRPQSIRLHFAAQEARPLHREPTEGHDLSATSTSHAMAGCPRTLPAPVPAGSAVLTRREVLAVARPSRGAPAAGRFAALAPPRPREDAEAAGEYAVDDMVKQMLSRESQFTPKWGFMRLQPYITPEHRAALVERFSSLREHFGLRRETVFLSVNVLDRYLSLVEVRQRHLELVGMAAFLIAAKFEEIKPPDVKDLLQNFASDCNKQQVVKKELEILTRLRFEIASPTPLHLLVHLSAAAGPASGRPAVAGEQHRTWRGQIGAGMRRPRSWRPPCYSTRWPGTRPPSSRRRRCCSATSSAGCSPGRRAWRA